MRPWVFAAFLVVWGNLLHPLIGASAVLPGGSWQFVAAGAAMAAISLLVARALGLDREALGLTSRGVAPSIGIGAVVGTAVAAIDLAALGLAPSLIGQPVRYAPLAGLSADALARHVAFLLPLAAVIPEEIAFRGTLLSAIAKRHGARIAVLASAVVFALWHVSVAVVTVSLVPMPGVLVPLAIAGALAIVTLGGAALAALRMLTGSLASSIAAHWAFNGMILFGLWLAERTTASPG